MKYTHKQYAQALYESLQETKPKDQDTLIENFVQILKDKGDLAEYEKIIAAYEIYDRQQRGVTEVEVKTAEPIKLNKPLLDQLNKIIGEDIQIKEKIDGNLIGGVVIKAGDTLIDGSIKHHLQNLRETLTSTE